MAIFVFGTCSMLFSSIKSYDQFARVIQFHSKFKQLSQIHINRILRFFDRYTDIRFFLFFRLIHCYSDFMEIIFLIVCTWSIDAICWEMLLLNVNMVQLVWIIYRLNRNCCLIVYLIFIIVGLSVFESFSCGRITLKNVCQTLNF